MIRLIISFMMFCFVPISVFADTVTAYKTYSVNDTVSAQNLNGNITTILAALNGGLDNNNANTTSGYRFFETKSALPTAGNQGRVVYLTSDNSINFDSGSAWNKVPSGGIALPTGAVFFMITGSCPTGSTDISATYPNKFIKINATAGTSAAAVLTATTDSHVLTTAEVPNLSIDITTRNSNGDGAVIQGSDTQNQSHTVTVSTTNGGGGGHTHTISAPTTLAPSSITAILCQVN